MKNARALSGLLRSHRQAVGLTLEALSEASKISARTISDIERGVSNSPQARTVEALAVTLRLEPVKREEFLRAARSRGRSRGVTPQTSAGTPHRILDFSGREAEIAEVTAYLDVAGDRPESTAILLTGAPGIGKTASAMTALDRPHGGPAEIVFVDLDGFSAGPLTPLQVLKAVLRQMPGIGDKAPADLDEAGRLWQAASGENPRSVVLDNAADESQVRPVLVAHPSSKVIITSRRSLAGLENVERVTLGPLSEKDSVQLLTRLIPDGQRQAGDLVELARLSDCIPLALRIVGNRIASRPAWQAAEFAERMRSTENRLRLLVAGDLAVEAAFALSYNDLDPATAHLFRSISVIDGATFDARIAAATAGIDVVDADHLLEELTDLGLVESREGSRYRVHDLIRLYAAARLEKESSGHGGREARDRLRAWLLASLERAGAWFEPHRVPETRGQTGAAFPDSATAQAWIRQEEPHWWPALKAAARMGDHEVVADVPDALHWFSKLWIEWGHWRELFALAVASAQALGDKRLEAMHLGYLVWATVIESGDDAEAVGLAELGVAAATLSGDPAQLGWTKFYAGWMYYRVGRIEESAVLALESITEFETMGDSDGAAQAMTIIARLQIDRAGHERIIVALQQIVARMDEERQENRAAVRKCTLLQTYELLSVSYVALDRRLDALEATSNAVEIAREFESGIRLAAALRYRAVVQLGLGNFDAAARDIAHALSYIDPQSVHAVVVRQKQELLYLRQQAAECNSRPEFRIPH